MKISYEQIAKFCEENNDKFEGLLNAIDKKMSHGRDKKGIPIYSTKLRIKSSNSIYLKTKRDKDKINNLWDITDYAGYRILCLFEQNFYDIHKYIIISLKDDFILTQFKIFNWWDKEYERMISKLTDYVHSSYANVDIVINPSKTSGYKSIHYLFKQDIAGKEYFIEIQLRTLLQDVWSELEHSLSYKQGNIHPHIKKSFALLARDIETNDSLMTHLKSISDKERASFLYSMEKAGPVNYFPYEPEKIPDIFEQGELEEYYEKYIALMSKLNLREDKDRQEEAQQFFDMMCEKITIKMQKDKKIKYFIKMEDAFLNYWKGNLDEALNTYGEIEKEFKDHYILQFRMGEIYFAKGEIEKALVSFDHCEKLPMQGSDLEKFNRYRINLKLAFIYWLLGSEYIDFTIEKINEAENIYQECIQLIPDQKESFCNLLNNICAYHLDRYLIAKQKGDTKAKGHKKMIQDYYKVAISKLKRLEKYLKSNKLRENANALDTIAWFYYNIYLNDGNPINLQIAKTKCQLIGERENRSTFWMTSSNIQQNHIQEIMCAK